jgi:hypothetical protein
MSELLAMFKKSIGDMSDDVSLDDYYTNFLAMAQAQLQAEDISSSILESELGRFAVVLTAQLLMGEKSIADNPTLILLRNLLTAATKAERYTDDNG